MNHNASSSVGTSRHHGGSVAGRPGLRVLHRGEEKELGGNYRKLFYTLEGLDTQNTWRSFWRR